MNEKFNVIAQGELCAFLQALYKHVPLTFPTTNEARNLIREAIAANIEEVFSKWHVKLEFDMSLGVSPKLQAQGDLYEKLCETISTQEVSDLDTVLLRQFMYMALCHDFGSHYDEENMLSPSEFIDVIGGEIYITLYSAPFDNFDKSAVIDHVKQMANAIKNIIEIAPEVLTICVQIE